MLCNLTLLANSIHHSPLRGANSCSSIHKTPCMLWNSKVRHRVYSSLPRDPILSRMNPVHIHLSYLRYVPYCAHLRLPLLNGPLPSGFLSQNTHFYCTMSATCHDHPFLVSLLVQLFCAAFCIRDGFVTGHCATDSAHKQTRY